MPINPARWFVALSLIWLAFTASLPAQSNPLAPVKEHTFPVLRTKIGVYTNVTVTTKAPSYIFIAHSKGLSNIKIENLSANVQNLLGYPPNKNKLAWVDTDEETSAGNNTPSAVVTAVSPALVVANLRASFAKDLPKLPPLPQSTLYIAIAIAAVLYLFVCFCCLLICVKTTGQTSFLVWIPVLQLLPLLHAAGMSRAWFLAFLVPVVNVIAHIAWCINIAKACGKSPWLALPLLLPLTNLLALMYLAFSNCETEAKATEKAKPEFLSPLPA